MPQVIFHVKVRPEVEKEDLPSVCEDLKKKFNLCTKILGINPYECYIEIDEDRSISFRSHDLTRELLGYRAIEIPYRIEGYLENYRLVYRIIDKDRIKQVEVISFGLHDYSYDMATSRISLPRR